MIIRLALTVFLSLGAAAPLGAAVQSPPEPAMPPGSGIAAIWSQLLGTSAGQQPAQAFAPPPVELRFVLAGDRRFCAEYDIWYRTSADGTWTKAPGPAVVRPQDIGGFAVSKTDFPMTLCRLAMAADWFEAAVSEPGDDVTPVTVWSPTGKAVQSFVAGGASVGRRNGRVDQIVMVTLGDTGCRGTPAGATGRWAQDCATGWAFPDLMEKVIQVKLDDGSLAEPDFFLHLGDYRYFWEDYDIDPSKGRTPGNEGESADNLGFWLQEFLTPAQHALTIAPWALTRGNHEACPNAQDHWYGQGWTYLFGDVDWPSQPCNNLVPTTYFDVGPDGGKDPKTRHRVVVVDNSDPTSAAYGGRSMADLFKDAVSVTGEGDRAYVGSTHWASHIPGVTYLAYCQGQCAGQNGQVLQAVDDAFEAWVPCQDRGPGQPRCVPSTLFRGHQHFFQRIRLSDSGSPKKVSVPWSWPQTYIVGHGGTSPDYASFKPDWCWSDFVVPDSASGQHYKGNVLADSRHGFVVWRRAADTLARQAGWAEALYWQSGGAIQPPDVLSACALE